MKKVVIFGAGGHARVIADIVSACGDRLEAFLDDDRSISKASGPVADYVNYPDCEFIIGIGSTEIRKKIAALPVKWYTAIHPSAVVSPSVVIGNGSVVMPLAVINAGATVGEHAIINTGAIVEHDNLIGNYAHISVGAKLGGTVTVGDSTWIGIGATVRNNIEIYNDCLIGAGAVVVNDITESGKYIGLPARKNLDD